METYLPLFMMLLVAGVVALVMFTLTTNLGPKKPSAEKDIPYESGSETVGATYARPSVKFYMTAISFVVFDVEVVFLYPWASSFRSLGWTGFGAILLFLVMLAVSLVYEWRKGALEWER